MNQRYRESGSRWLQRLPVDPPPARVLTCTSFHTALVAILALVTRPGEGLVAETLTYPGLRTIARRAASIWRDVIHAGSRACNP